MKKSLLIISICVLLTTCCIWCSACSLLYNLQQDGTIWLGYNKTQKKCFVANIEWNPNDGNRIEIPTEYLGATVDTLGGYFGRGVPSPFVVSVPIQELYPDADEYYGTSESCLHQQPEGWWDILEVYDYPITIVLPDNLKKVEYVLQSVEVAQYTIDGKTLCKVARVVYQFEIAPTNDYFYTSEGRLYRKEDDKPIEGFVYDSWAE